MQVSDAGALDREVAVAAECDMREKYAFAGYLLIELSFFVLLLAIVKDWLFSSASPYPYAASTALSAACWVGLELLWRRDDIRSPAARLVLRGAVVLIWIIAIRNWAPGTISAAFVVAMAAWGIGATKGASSRQGKAARFAGAILLAAGLAFLTYKALWPDLSLLAGGDVWLGNGLRASSSGAEALFASSLLRDWGLLANIAAGLLFLSAIFSGVRWLWDTANGEARTALALCAGAIGVLCGLLLTARQGASFLTADSIAGSWAFVLAVAVIGIETAALKAAPAPQPETRRARRAWKQWAFVVLGVVLMGGGYAAHLLASKAVAPYIDHAAPVRFAANTPLALIAQPMQDATLAMEDHAFYQHHGFDWIAMHHALRLDLREGRVEEGGSTITQQLAKNLFLSSDRTVLRKVEEAAYTWELERMLPKRRILELYLNTIDYGMGQHGITAAARYYFHKTPAQLTLTESAILVGIVPDPMQRQVDFQRLSDGRQTALGRIRYFFPQRYSQNEVDLDSGYSLDHLIYPEKDAWDRGATEEIPADWHGVKFYFFASPEEPLPIDQAARCLKERMAGFLDDAHQHLHLAGIDHLGVYNDRTMRQSATATSAHAFGQAIDISGFRFADGSRVSVKDHDNPRVMARLAPLEAMLKRHFDIVVDWNDDPLRHQTHFHTEVKGPRPTTPRPVDGAFAQSVH